MTHEEIKETAEALAFALKQVESSQIKNPGPSFMQAYEALQEDVFASDEVQSLCNDAEEFLGSINIGIDQPRDCRDRAAKLLAKLEEIK